MFAVIYHQYIDIHHAKKRSENIISSYSFRFFETLFHYISECVSVTYIESGLCQLGKELDNHNIQLHCHETDILQDLV